MYFGYDFPDESNQNRQYQADFVGEINEKFPNVKLHDAYDQIKGFRKEVSFTVAKDAPENSMDDQYYSWLIGKDWFEMSMTMQLIMMSGDEEHKKQWNQYFALAKKDYPEAFKPEAL